MRVHLSIFLSLLVFSVSGCALHPQTEDFSRSTIPAIVEQIRCEAKNAIFSHLPKNRDYLNHASVVYFFTFQLTEDNDLNSNQGSIVFPIAQGSLTLGWSAGVEKQRYAQQKVKFADEFSDLEKLVCDEVLQRKNYIYPITGEIGLVEVFRNFFQLHDSRPGSLIQIFSDEVRFNTKISASGSAAIRLTPALGKTINASLAGTTSRIDDHQLILTIDPGETDLELEIAQRAQDELAERAYEAHLAQVRDEKSIPALIKVIDGNNVVISPPFAVDLKDTKATERPKNGADKNQRKPSMLRPNERRSLSRDPKPKSTESRPIIRKRVRTNTRSLVPRGSRKLSKQQRLRRAIRKAEDELRLDRTRKLRNFADDELNN